MIVNLKMKKWVEQNQPSDKALGNKMASPACVFGPTSVSIDQLCSCGCESFVFNPVTAFVLNRTQSGHR